MYGVTRAPPGDLDDARRLLQLLARVVLHPRPRRHLPQRGPLGNGAPDVHGQDLGCGGGGHAGGQARAQLPQLHLGAQVPAMWKNREEADRAGWEGVSLGRHMAGTGI